MFLQILTEHQIHILLRIRTVSILFFGFLASLTFLSRRNAARQKDLKDSERRGQAETLAKDGWRKPKRKKTGGKNEPVLTRLFLDSHRHHRHFVRHSVLLYAETNEIFG